VGETDLDVVGLSAIQDAALVNSSVLFSSPVLAGQVCVKSGAGLSVEAARFVALLSIGALAFAPLRSVPRYSSKSGSRIF
jgi:hypothetical protein